MILRMLAGFVVLISLCATSVQAAQPGKLELEPNHYFYVPNSNVLEQRQFVASFHELALGIDRNLMVFISPFASVGGIFLGVKYGRDGDWSLGGGLASGGYWHSRFWGSSHYWIDRNGNYHYYYDYVYDYDLGLGMFVTKAIATRANITGNLRIWDGYLRLSGGFGGESPIGDVTELVYEGQVGFGVGSHYDPYPYVVRDQDGNIEGGIGIRYTFPMLRPLKLTLGLCLDKGFVHDYGFDAWPYLDLSFASNF